MSKYQQMDYTCDLRPATVIGRHWTGRTAIYLLLSSSSAIFPLFLPNCSSSAAAAADDDDDDDDGGGGSDGGGGGGDDDDDDDNSFDFFSKGKINSTNFTNKTTTWLLFVSAAVVALV